MFQTLEVFGPEHEFALVDETLQPVPIVDQVIKELRGRIVNFVNCQTFTFGKELQAHVAEIKANTPFFSPIVFEDTMQNAVERIHEVLVKKFDVQLLGTGMHPFLRPSDARIWAHRDRHIYDALHHIFNLYQHGWVNIHAFQLNLSYGAQSEALRLHNLTAQILPYVPAIAASTPIYEGGFSKYCDTRLHFYQQNQTQVPSLTGNIVPEPASSFHSYRQQVIARYSRDLAAKGAPRCLLQREWLNSRGVIFRFDRRAIEIRIMDEQECIKADVALSCFLRACLRGLMSQDFSCVPRQQLIQDMASVIRDGLAAQVQHPYGPTAKHVCQSLLEIAEKYAFPEERRYLPFVRRRIKSGCLSDVLRRDVVKKAQRTTMHEAIVSIYSRLIQRLQRNEMYF